MSLFGNIKWLFFAAILLFGLIFFGDTILGSPKLFLLIGIFIFVMWLSRK